MLPSRTFGRTSAFTELRSISSINRKPVCDFLIVTDSLTSYLVPFRSHRSLLFKFWTLCVFDPPLGGLETTYDVHLDLIGKRVLDFLLVSIELFSLGRTAEALRAKIDRKSAISLQHGHFDQKFRIEGVAPTSHFFTDS